MPTPTDELNRYLEQLIREGATEATIKNNKGYCKSYIRFCTATNNRFGLADITPKTVNEHLISLCNQRFTDKTIICHVGGTLKFCRWLAAEEKIPSELFAKVQATTLLADLKKTLPQSG